MDATRDEARLDQVETRLDKLVRIVDVLAMRRFRDLEAQTQDLKGRLQDLEGRALARLPPRARRPNNHADWKAVKAAFVTGVTQKDVARLTGLPPSTVRRYIRMSPDEVTMLRLRANHERFLAGAAPEPSAARPLDEGVLQATLAVEAEFDDPGPA
jgi:hypothetical protein